MVDTPKELVNATNESFKNMDEEAPDFMPKFRKVLVEAEKENALSTKVKELITVALGLAARCPFCIAFHVKNAITAGATRAEIVEACNVAIMMGGAPNATYMKHVFDAMDEYGAE